MKRKASILVFALLGVCASVARLYGATKSDEFPDICTLDQSRIQVGSILKMRAAEVPEGGWYVAGLAGRNCTKKPPFIVKKNESSALVDEINSALNAGVYRKGLAIEADVTLYMAELRPGIPKDEIPPTWYVVIKNAKNFRPVSIRFDGP